MTMKNANVLWGQCYNGAVISDHFAQPTFALNQQETNVFRKIKKKIHWNRGN